MLWVGHVVWGCHWLTGGQELVASSAALACLGNVGPGFIQSGQWAMVGCPHRQNHLIVAMWVGRLEM